MAQSSLSLYEPAIVSLLLMFRESAHTVDMILHATNALKSAVQHMNAGQVPVFTVDQPLFALAKEIQKRLPEAHGGDNFVIVLGGLHIEMVAF